MKLTEYRQSFKPFEYPEVEQYIEGINDTYWVHREIDFNRDVQEFHTELNATERYIVGTILKTFAQTEIHVADEFWGRLYDFFPKPEFYALGTTFSENEMRHAFAYDKLNEVLDLTDYETFLEDPVAKDRLANMMKMRKTNKGSYSVRDIAKTLFIFSGLVENVNLFSQFAILRSFSSNGRNLLNNIADIIDWSQLDEGIHAQAGLHFFNVLVKENPEIMDDELKSDLYVAAKVTYDIEVDLIEQIFKEGELPNLSKECLLNFMKARINQSLLSVGLKAIYNVDKVLLMEISWFEDNFKALSHKDFFTKRSTEYTKNKVVFNADTVKVSREDILKLI